MADFFAIGTDVFIGSGTVAATPGTWTSAGCVVSAKPSGKTKSFREKRPCLNSPNRKVKRVPGSVTESAVNVTLEFDVTQFEELWALLDTDDTVPVAVVIGDTGKAQKGTYWIESIDIPDLVDEGDVQMTVSFIPANEDDIELVNANTITGGS